MGPVTKGVRLVYPLATMLKKQKLFNDGSSTSTIELLLKETSGWLIDPQNTLAAWKAPTTCQFIQVLSSLSSLNILGDFTTWYETVALDNVRIITNTNKQTNQNNDVLPLCALKKPDASVCSC